jgi:uncharacterized protein (DUF1778 family)
MNVVTSVIFCRKKGVVMLQQKERQQPKEVELRIRLTLEQKLYLQERCKAKGMTVSEFVRQAIRDKVGRL